jgi:hypothetical protein
MDPITVQILVAVFDGVMKAIPEAVAAYEAIRQMVAQGRDPTAAEWQQITLAVVAVHNQVQAPPAAPDPAPAVDPAAAA